jgi:hypothetical protein
MLQRVQQECCRESRKFQKVAESCRKLQKVAESCRESSKNVAESPESCRESSKNVVGGGRGVGTSRTVGRGVATL